tara:strand:+ start:12369 stop:13091 length:723 start_codon:yes stop_codon:yes gene_type:complete
MKLKEFKKINKNWDAWRESAALNESPERPSNRSRGSGRLEQAHASGELAQMLAQDAAEAVGSPDGAAIENEIHAVMDGMVPPPTEEERWQIADQALSIAGEILGVGPDMLQEVRLSSYWKKRAAMRARKGRREFPNRVDREWARAQQKRSTAVQGALSALHPQSTAAIEEEIEEDINDKFEKELSEEYTGNEHLIIEPAQQKIEEILNDLYDNGIQNPELIALLQSVIKDIENGFVGEPT